MKDKRNKDFRVIGLDLSLRETGVYVVNHKSGPVYKDTLRPPKGQIGVIRLNWIAHMIANKLSIHKPRFVVIEGYSMMSKGRVFNIGELGGVVRLLLFREGFPFVTIPPCTLKKWATGKGNAGKAEMIAEAARRGLSPRNDNEADAALLALLGLECADHGFSGVKGAEIEPPGAVLGPKIAEI